MLRGDHGEFWLEPVAVSTDNQTATAGDLGAADRAVVSMYGGPTGPAGRPHLVFRRSAEQQQQQIEIGAGGRSKRRRKKKRKQERNCGTRGEKPRHLPLAPVSLLCSSLYEIFESLSLSLSLSFFLSRSPSLVIYIVFT